MKPRNPPRLSVFLLFAVLAVLSACNRSWETGRNSSDLPKGTLEIAGDERLVLEVDLALTGSAQARGLMEVEQIPDDYGMVFLWSDSAKHSFYMKNTLIPLDIAWWDGEGNIVDIQTMQPCTEDPCKTYVPADTHVGAVEVNAGLLEEAGVEVGDKVTLTRAT
jgi:uncharacterized membrane protein (UPF0127 family)